MLTKSNTTGERPWTALFRCFEVTSVFLLYIALPIAGRTALRSAQTFRGRFDVSSRSLSNAVFGCPGARKLHLEEAG